MVVSFIQVWVFYWFNLESFQYLVPETVACRATPLSVNWKTSMPPRVARAAPVASLFSVPARTSVELPAAMVPSWKLTLPLTFCSADAPVSWYLAAASA